MNNNFNIKVQKQDVEDIFQVSINSKKLMSILKKLEENYKALQKKVDRIDDFYKEGDSALNRKIISAQNANKNLLKDQFGRVKTQLQIEMRRYQQKYIKQLKDKQQKMNQLKYSIETVNQKINKVNQGLVRQMQNTTRNYSTQMFALRRSLQVSEQAIHEQIEGLAQQIQACINDVEIDRETLFDMEIKIKKQNGLALRPSQSDLIPYPQKKFGESINGQKYSNFLQTDLQNLGSLRQRQKSLRSLRKSGLNNPVALKKHRMLTSSGAQNKPNNENYMSTLQYASISAKVEDLQRKIIQNNQRVSEPRRQRASQQPEGMFRISDKMMKTIQYSKDKFQNIIPQKGLMQKSNFENVSEFQILTSIINKLQMLQNQMQAKQKNLNKNIDEVREKNMIICEKIDFVKQKQNKTNLQISQVKIKLLALEKKGSQEPQFLSISSIQNQLGKVIQRLDRQSQIKLNIQQYNEERNKIYQKLNFVQQNLIYKAEKDDVKKAILFLQDKVKQIILVMANQFNQQKVGSINKISPKCLTCDRQVIKIQNIANVSSNTGLKGTSSKSSRQLGQKYYTRLLKSKKQDRNTKKGSPNYASFTQVTEETQLIQNFP